MADHENEQEEDFEEEEKYYVPYSLTQVDDYGILNNLMPVEKVVQCLEKIYEEFTSNDVSKEIKADVKERGCVELVMLRSMELSKRRAEQVLGRTLKLQPRHDDVQMDLNEFFGYVQHYPKDQRVISLMKEIEPVFLPYNVHTITKLDKKELPPPVTAVEQKDEGKAKQKNIEKKGDKVVRERKGGSDARAAARERRATQKT